MAIALVGSAFAGAASGNGTTCATSPAVSNAAGNALIGWGIWEDTTTTLTAADTALTTYTPLTQGTPNGVHGVMFHGANSPGHASNVVTYTIASAAAFKRIVVSEWSGCATSSLLDQQNAASGSGTVVTSGNITVQSGDLILVGIGCYGSVSAAPGANWTEIYDNGTIKLFYRIAPSTGTYGVTSGADGITIGSQDWICKIASFKAAAAGGPAFMPARGLQVNQAVNRASSF